MIVSTRPHFRFLSLSLFLICTKSKVNLLRGTTFVYIFKHEKNLMKERNDLVSKSSLKRYWERRGEGMGNGTLGVLGLFLRQTTAGSVHCPTWQLILFHVYQNTFSPSGPHYPSFHRRRRRRGFFFHIFFFFYFFFIFIRFNYTRARL